MQINTPPKDLQLSLSSLVHRTTASEALQHFIPAKSTISSSSIKQDSQNRHHFLPTQPTNATFNLPAYAYGAAPPAPLNDLHPAAPSSRQQPASLMPIIVPSLSRAQHRNTNIDHTTTLSITLSYDNKPADCTPFRVPNSALGVLSEEEVDEMGLAYNVYLNADRIFGCKNCKTHLATHDSIISRNFRGQHGKAYLFASVVNIQQADAVERNMTTGRHVVRDISCRQCKETVGWKYDKAYEASEKYKEGKYILEAELLCAVY